LIDVLVNVPTRQVQAVCASNLTDIWNGLSAYESDHAAYPDSLQQAIDKGYLTAKACQCPALSYLSRRGVEYLYVRGLQRQDPREWLLAFDLPHAHSDDSRNVLYLSGRVAHLSAGEFEEEYQRFVEEFQRARGEKPKIE
jgi:hypothetical protein